MARKEMFGLLLVAALVGSGPAWAKVRHHRHGSATGIQARHGDRRHAGTGRPYASAVSPTITCRYPDGTPYDPDILGGPNHVGEGGPAVNFGGFDPCGY